MVKKRTGVPTLDKIETLKTVHAAMIAAYLMRVDPARMPAMVVAASATAAVGAVFIVLGLLERTNMLWTCTGCLPMTAFIFWVNPRNQRHLTPALGYPDIQWDEAVRRHLDEYLKRELKPSEKPKPRKTIGF